MYGKAISVQCALFRVKNRITMLQAVAGSNLKRVKLKKWEGDTSFFSFPWHIREKDIVKTPRFYCKK